MNNRECYNVGGYVCCHPTYWQAERTRAEEQLQQNEALLHEKDSLIRNINTELQQTRTQLEHEEVIIRVLS